MFQRLCPLMIAATAGTVLVAAPQDPGKKHEPPPVNYEAEEGLPKDAAAEKRRDYAVLEATLNDLTSPKNPEYKFHIENVGPGREIVINGKTFEYASSRELPEESDSIDRTETRSIPAELRDDFKRRNKGAVRSLADFKPANPDILVRDLDKAVEKTDDFLDEFSKKYPKAWGFVWACHPAYSSDGQSAVVLFEGGPNGVHGLTWTYMLTRKTKRWEVQWRHCHPRE
jgi:hypothetical protein